MSREYINLNVPQLTETETYNDMEGGNMLTDVAIKTCDTLHGAVKKVKESIFGKSENTPRGGVITTTDIKNKASSVRKSVTSYVKKSVRSINEFGRTAYDTWKALHDGLFIHYIVRDMNDSNKAELMNAFYQMYNDSADYMVASLNTQDKDGNTPGHLVLLINPNTLSHTHQREIIDQFKAWGMDLKTKNNHNEYIESETCAPPSERCLKQEVTAHTASPTTLPIAAPTVSPSGGRRSEVPNTEAYIESLVNKYSGPSTENTEVFLDNIMRKYAPTNSPQSMLLGGGNETLTTEAYLNHLIGGKKNTKKSAVSGSRKMNTYSDYITTSQQALSSHGGKKARKSSKKTKATASKFSSDLSRLVNNQANEIMKNVITYLKDNVTNGDEELARDYKAALWRMVKEKFPNETNLNLVIELEKMAKDKKIIKKIDPKKAKQYREESRKASEERRAARQSSANSSDSPKKASSAKRSRNTSTISATSEGNINSNQVFSATSYSQNKVSSVSSAQYKPKLPSPTKSSSIFTNTSMSDEE